MSKTALKDVLAHWDKLIENFNTSSLEFYGALEDALKRRQIHGLNTRCVDWHEGGVISPRREYLRIEGDRLIFDVCAAPFGTGFFFSWWLVGRRPKWVIFYLLLLLVTAMVAAAVIGFALAAMTQPLWGSLLGSVIPLLLGPFVVWPLAGLVAMWSFAILAGSGVYGPELAILSVPGLGWLYRALFAPDTYYRLDTASMFQKAVHAAVVEVMDGLLTRKGLRALSQEERKPVLHELLESPQDTVEGDLPSVVRSGGSYHANTLRSTS